MWRRAGRDLGDRPGVPGRRVVGLGDLALTSVRDLYASGGPPELAGGDFGAEAHRLGTMAARMHLGLDEAFGRRPGNVGDWADAIEDAVRPVAPTLLDRPDVVELLEELRGAQVPCSRPSAPTATSTWAGVSRTEQGWYVVDFAAGRAAGHRWPGS